jgi:NADPH:quinone reductase-like Zn-dependent oxidoreductase
MQTPGTSTPDTDTDADMDTTMRAIVQTAYGDTVDVLRHQETPRPSPGEGEVLLRVHAAGMDRGTWHLMTGRPYLMRVIGFGFRRPKNAIAGLDVAGTVVAIGPGVTRFAVGDEVFGISRGSYAEYAVAREDKLAARPQVLSPTQAAAVGVSGLTALQGLTDVGRVQAGQRVLVIGASGGVGSFAVQIATALGAEVTGVASAAKADLVRSLGAVRVLDYATEDFADGRQHYDLVLDVGGNSSLRRLRRAQTPTGTLVIVGGEGGDSLTGGMGRQLLGALMSPFIGQRLTMVASKEHYSGLERLAELAAQGHLTPAVDRTYPLDRVPDAMRDLMAGRARGKLVIAVAE